jgi:hydrogenase/urease accessory protein HupE
MRKVAVVVSVALFGVGVWLLTRVHSVSATCTATVSLFTGKGVNPDCENVATFYFLGFGLTILGLIIFTLALVAMAKRDRDERRSRRRSISNIRRHEPQKLKDVA